MERADPGEVVTMSFPMKNIGSGLTTNLNATLQSSGGITPLSGPQSYGVLSPIGPAVSRDFTFAVDASIACGGTVTATFLLDDAGESLGTVSFTIRVGATVTNTTTLSNPTAIVIPGAGTGAATGAPANPYPSNIIAGGLTGTVTNVRVTLNNFSHTFPGDVDVLLVGPGGQKFTVVSDVIGGTDAVNITWVLDDAGATIMPDNRNACVGYVQADQYRDRGCISCPGAARSISVSRYGGGGYICLRLQRDKSQWHLEPVRR